MDHLTPAERPDQVLINKKKKKKKKKRRKKGTCSLVNFAVPADHRMQIKENKTAIMAIARIQRKSHTATKYADSSLHRLHCFVLTPCSGVSLPTDRLGVSLLTLNAPLLRTDCFSAPHWLTSFVLLLQTRRFSRVQFPVWSPHQYRPRKVFWTLRRRFKDVGDKISSLATHPRTHRDPHIIIHINIHTYINAHYRATPHTTVYHGIPTRWKLLGLMVA